MSKATRIMLAAMAQNDWIDAHGGASAGYTARYGADGAAIFAADEARLDAILGGAAPAQVRDRWAARAREGSDLVDIIIRIRPMAPIVSAQTDDANVQLVIDKHLDRLKKSFGDRYEITIALDRT